MSTKAKLMRLYTMTDQACWLAAKDRGFLVNDKSYVDPHFAKSYEWMHARFHEHCKRSPTFGGSDSLVWCPKDYDRTAIRLKPVSAAADEWVLVFLDTSLDTDTVSLRIEVLEDFCELTDPYHRLTLGPVTAQVLPDGDACSVQLLVPDNPDQVKLCLTGPDQPGVFGDYVQVQFVCTSNMWNSKDWAITNYGSITACKKSIFTKRWHRILVECDIPDEDVLLSSEDAFVMVINNITNDSHDFINWNASLDETDEKKLYWDAPRDQCFENYKGIFDLDNCFPIREAYDIRGVTEGIPLSAVRSVWHMYDAYRNELDY